MTTTRKKTTKVEKKVDVTNSQEAIKELAEKVVNDAIIDIGGKQVILLSNFNVKFAIEKELGTLLKILPMFEQGIPLTYLSKMCFYMNYGEPVSQQDFLDAFEYMALHDQGEQLGRIASRVREVLIGKA